MSRISPVQPFAANRADACTQAPRAPAPVRSGAFQVPGTRRPSAPGKFELVRVDGGGFLIRVLDGNGAVLALTKTYPDLAAAVEGVEAVRECAATSHISDQTSRAPEARRVPTEIGAGLPAGGRKPHTLPMP